MDSPNLSGLVLGLAQLGMAYGIANTTGQPSLRTAEKIIQTSWENGIREFDTAQEYGESERILGIILQKLGLSNNARVISKPHPDFNSLNMDAHFQVLSRSLERLQCSTIYGYLLHREDLLDFWAKGLARILNDFVKLGLVRHVGISVYTPERALEALKCDGIDLLQVPTSILDHRFEKAGVFELARELGKKVYVRSVFLQGLAILRTEDVPKTLRFALPILEKLDFFAQEYGLSRNELALGYIKNAQPHAKVILGVEHPRQILENITLWKKEYPWEIVERARSEFGELDETILNPSLWPKGTTAQLNPLVA